jgi:hypothetical protein
MEKVVLQVLGWRDRNLAVGGAAGDARYQLIFTCMLPFATNDILLQHLAKEKSGVKV